MKSVQKPFVVARKISRRMFRIYLLLYLLSLLLIALIIVPLMSYYSYTNCRNTVADIAANYEDMQAQISAVASNLIYSDVIENQLFVASFDTAEMKKSNIELALNSFINRNPNVMAINVNTGSGDTYYAIFSYKYDLPAIMDADPNFRELMEHNKSSYWGPVITDVFDTSSMSYRVFSYSTVSTKGNNKYELTIFYNANSYMKNNDRLLSRTMNSYTVLDRNGNLMYSSAGGVRYDDMQEMTAHIAGAHMSADGIYCYATVSSSGWKVVGFVSYFLLFRNALIIILAITVLSFIAPYTYVRYLNQAVTDELSPVRELSDIMSSFSIGQTVRTDIHTNDEIQTMCDAFNSMVTTINRQTYEIGDQEKKNAMISYKLLVTQIDPHFIYNTMNVINIMARNGETEAIVEINSALIKILRERLNVKLSVLNTIEEEIQTLEQYNLIMRYRFSNHVNTYISVAPELMNVRIPKNILQPLVENALYHGFDSTNPENSLDVDIMVYGQDDSIVIEVSDNGKGMSPDRLETIRQNSSDLYKDEKPHIGIDNIRQRLAFLYGERSSIEITSALNAGTHVVITIPMRNERDADFR